MLAADCESGLLHNPFSCPWRRDRTGQNRLVFMHNASFNFKHIVPKGLFSCKNCLLCVIEDREMAKISTRLQQNTRYSGNLKEIIWMDALHFHILMTAIDKFYINCGFLMTPPLSLSLSLSLSDTGEQVAQVTIHWFKKVLPNSYSHWSTLLFFGNQV